MRLKKILRRLLITLAILFVVANIIAASHAYHFTHFAAGGKRVDPYNMSAATKVKLLFTGVSNPKPYNFLLPTQPYTTLHVQSNVPIECWRIKSRKKHKGVVLLFHGYMSCKSMMLSRAQPFLDNGYDCVLVDFMGSGGSGGNATTIGFKEAQEVADCYKAIAATGEKNIFLFGSSMGAAAILKAVAEQPIKPSAIVIECPFGSMSETVSIRFKMMGVPEFPLAKLLMFWGGVENGFNAFSHNPADYAKKIKCPTLLQWGEKDDRVTRGETESIYANLHCEKKLVTYPKAGHNNCISMYHELWTKNVVGFCDGHVR